jgi:putative membrane protein
MNVLADHWHGGPGAWWPLIPLAWALFLILIVGTVLFVLRRRGGPGAWRGRPSGESVLAERYARGEIDEDEYRKRLAFLKDVES